MAALLRQGARRIGGSVIQRTQAAVVAEERRRLMPRRMATDTAPSGQKLQQKKDELYEVLSKTKPECLAEKRLLQHLAGYVKPGPGDTQWSRLRASRWANNVAMVVSNISFVIGTATFVVTFGNKVKSYLAKNEGD